MYRFWHTLNLPFRSYLIFYKTKLHCKVSNDIEMSHKVSHRGSLSLILYANNTLPLILAAWDPYNSHGTNEEPLKIRSCWMGNVLDIVSFFRMVWRRKIVCRASLLLRYNLYISIIISQATRYEEESDSCEMEEVCLQCPINAFCNC